MAVDGGEYSGKLTAEYGAKGREPKIGPEFTFGIYMQKLLDEPILIIKTAWGGKSLHTDFRSPSAGPYELNQQQVDQFTKRGMDLDEWKADKAKATGHYYRLMTDHVKKVLKDIKSVYPDYDPRRGCELAGFVWFQGWNDMCDGSTYPNRNQPGGYDLYSKLLAHFIRDVRKDLSRRINVAVAGREGGVACQLAGRKEVRGAVRWRVVCWTRRRGPAARMSRGGGLTNGFAGFLPTAGHPNRSCPHLAPNGIAAHWCSA